jgi:hypothetical protein
LGYVPPMTYHTLQELVCWTYRGFRLSHLVTLIVLNPPQLRGKINGKLNKSMDK